ncbi:hypothetical protein HC891_27055 [Candidatus Gracilibacteria bacterium]|nr:hypothetical protein [Candidatus Gracilibacteria bacterium]
MQHIRARSADALVFACAFAIIFVPYFIWRYSYYGDLLPNTFYAKTGGGLSQVLRGFGYTSSFALTLGGPLLLLIAVPWLRSWRAALFSWRSYLLLIVGVYSAYIVAVGGDHFRGERFFVPLIPLCAILLADGFLHCIDVLRSVAGAYRTSVRVGSAALLALVIVGGSMAALARTDSDSEIFRGLDESVFIWRDLGWWMADNAPSESIAAAGAGAIAFYGEATTIDLYGLTDRHIARVEMIGMGSGVAGHEKRDPDYVLNTRRVSYIPAIWQDYFGGPAALERDYELITIVTRSGREMTLWRRVEYSGFRMQKFRRGANEIGSQQDNETGR